MIVSTNIPGWNSRASLLAIAKYAADVPEHGNILELGGFFGRTTHAIGHNKKPSVILTTIDWWITYHLSNFTEHALHDGLAGPAELDLLNTKISPDPARIEGADFYNLWKEYTAGITNSASIKSSTNLPNDDFPLQDFIFHDAGHSYDEVYTDLRHWFCKLTPSGVFVIDDYAVENFPGLVAAVNRFVEEEHLILEIPASNLALLKRNYE